MYVTTLVPILLLSLPSLGSCRDEFTADGKFYRSWSGLTDVPDDIPEEAQLVDLDYNKIQVLKSFAFEDLGSCYNLRLSDNSISTIEPMAFLGLYKVTSLDLRNNDLTKVKSELFKGLNSLTTLRLDNNKIGQIADGGFRSVRMLQTLYLSGNELTEVTPEMLSGVKRLQTLTLDRNMIETIESGSFESVPELTSLKLDINKLTTLSRDVFSTVNPSRHLELSVQNNPIHCGAAICWMADTNSPWLTLHASDWEKQPVQCSNLPEDIQWDSSCPL